MQSAPEAENSYLQIILEAVIQNVKFASIWFIRLKLSNLPSNDLLSNNEQKQKPQVTGCEVDATGCLKKPSNTD